MANDYGSALADMFPSDQLAHNPYDYDCLMDFQSKAAKLRWQLVLEDFRNRGLFLGDRTGDEQIAALRRASRLLRSARKKGAGRGALQPEIDPSECFSGWRQIGGVVNNHFDYGSAGGYQKAIPGGPPFPSWGYTQASQAFIETGEISIGVGNGGSPSFGQWMGNESVGYLSGSSTFGGLGKIVNIPINAGLGALMVRCQILLGNPDLSLAPDFSILQGTSYVYVSGSATLDISLVPAVHSGNNSYASDSAEMFLRSADYSSADRIFTGVYDVVGTDLAQPIDLAATIGSPPDVEANLYVNVTIHYSAWSGPVGNDTLGGLAVADSTGRNNDTAIISTDLGNYGVVFSSANTQPVSVRNVLVCGTP